MEKIIELTNISKKYYRKEVLKNITFSIPKGKKVAIFGENGSGKTTTLNIIATIISSTKGDAKILGYDLKKEAQKIKKGIGFLPQDAELLQNEKLKDILLFFSKLKGISKEELEKIINQFSLKEIENQKISSLSHGMQKMVGLSQAFMGSPKLVILDEPFSGMDYFGRNQLKEIIKTFKGTVIFSTHQTTDALEVSDYYIHLNKGELISINPISKAPFLITLNFKNLKGIKTKLAVLKPINYQENKTTQNKNINFTILGKKEKQLMEILWKLKPLSISKTLALDYELKYSR